MTAPAATEGVRKDPLLAELLLPEQAHDLEAHGGFNVRGSDGNLYRILDKKLGLRNVLGESPRHIGRVLFGAWPCYRGGVIIADRIAVMLSQKILVPHLDSSILLAEVCLRRTRYATWT